MEASDIPEQRQLLDVLGLQKLSSDLVDSIGELLRGEIDADALPVSPPADP